MDYTKGDLVLIHTKTDKEKEYESRVGNITKIDDNLLYGTWGDFIADTNKDEVIVMIKIIGN